MFSFPCEAPDASQNFEFQKDPFIWEFISGIELTLDAPFTVVKYNTVAVVCCSWEEEALLLTFWSYE